MNEIREQVFVEVNGNEYLVSTVNIADMYYETIIFGSIEQEVDYSHEYYIERYKTEKEALEGHKNAIKNIKSLIKID